MEVEKLSFLLPLVMGAAGRAVVAALDLPSKGKICK